MDNKEAIESFKKENEVSEMFYEINMNDAHGGINSLASAGHHKDKMERNTLAIQALNEVTCEWTISNEDANIWKCNKCDATWYLTEGSPDENDMKYCMQCGRKITPPRKET